MKKTYALKIEGKHPDRVLEAVKHDIRKYIARERRKPLPAGVDYWDFDCRFGASAEAAEVIHFGGLTDAINETAAADADQFYVELIAKPGQRAPKPAIVEPKT